MAVVRMTIDPRIPTTSGRSTSSLHRTGRHQARSAVRRSASRMKGELHPTCESDFGTLCVPYLHMDDGVERLNSFFGRGHLQRQQWVYFAPASRVPDHIELLIFVFFSRWLGWYTRGLSRPPTWTPPHSITCRTIQFICSNFYFLVGMNTIQYHHAMSQLSSAWS